MKLTYYVNLSAVCVRCIKERQTDTNTLKCKQHMLFWMLESDMILIFFLLIYISLMKTSYFL